MKFNSLIILLLFMGCASSTQPKLETKKDKKYFLIQQHEQKIFKYDLMKTISKAIYGRKAIVDAIKLDNGNIMGVGYIAKSKYNWSDIYMYLVVVDQKGKLLSEKLFKKERYEEKLLGIHKLKDGNLLLVGVEEIDLAPHEMVKIIKMSQKGKIIYTKTYRTRYLFTHPIITGISSTNIAYRYPYDGYGKTFFIELDDGSVIFNTSGEVVKIDKNGDIIWLKKYDKFNKKAEEITGLLKLKDNSILVYGNTLYLGDTNTLLTIMDYNGNILWNKEYNFYNDYEIIKSVMYLKNGHILANIIYDYDRDKNLFKDDLVELERYNLPSNNKERAIVISNVLKTTKDKFIKNLLK